MTANRSVSLGLERYGHLAREPKLFTPELFTPERFLEIRPGDAFYDSFDSFGPRAHYRSVIERFDSARWRGDKIPKLHPLYDQIARAFSNPRIVFIVRNPFDVTASFQRRALNPDDRTWRGTRDYRNACTEWNASIRATIDWMDRLPIHVLDYESFFGGLADLVRLAAFLDLDPDGFIAGYEREVHRRRRRRPDALDPHDRQYVSRVADFAAYRELLEIADRNRLAGWPAARRTQRGLKEYQEEERESLDYERYEAASGSWFRGPPPGASSGSSIAFVGPSSTFGRFTRQPYPELTAAKLGSSALNLGRVETSPPFYYTDHRLLRLINESSCAVIECFSARGTGSRWFEARDYSTAFLRRRGSTEDFRFADRVFTEVLESWSERDLDRLKAEIRDAYLAEMRQLIALIEVPKILLCLSQEPLDEPGGFTSLDAFMGGYPHFVTPSVLEALAPHVDDVVEVVTAESSVEIASRSNGGASGVTGAATGPERHYFHPSPAVHQGAAQALVHSLSARFRLRSAATAGRSDQSRR